MFCSNWAKMPEKSEIRFCLLKHCPTMRRLSHDNDLIESSGAFRADREIVIGLLPYTARNLRVAPEQKLVCVKCGEEAVIHLRDEDAKCAKCFTGSVAQKFRAFLSKHQISKCREKILIAVTGGSASSALLQLIHEATGASHHSRLYFVPVVIHIDDSLDFAAENDSSRCKRIQNVLDVALQVDHNWTRLYSSLEMIFANEAENRVFVLSENAQSLEKCRAYRSRLRLLLDSVGSGTAKEELVKMLRAKLLKSIGKQLGITKMFVGDCVDRLAVQLITNTSLGKGKHLSIDLGYLDTRDPSFTIIRPLKEVTLKEIVMFNKLNGVTTMSESKDAAKSEKSTIFQMTKKFTEDLQAEFPQTVTTLCKTADKLAATGIRDNNGTSAACDICSGAVDSGTSTSACTAEASIALSLKLSSSADVEDMVNRIGGCDRKNGSCQSDSHGDNRDEEPGNCCRSPRKQTNMCYFCRWMLSEMKDPELLPDAFMGWTTPETRRQQMRESIQEFLLDDAEG